MAAAAGVTANAAAADTTTTTTTTTSTTTTTTTQDKTDYWNARAAQAQAATAHWQTVIRGRPPLQATHIESANSPGAAYQLWQTWHQRALAAETKAKNPPELHAWYCIHSYEGSWTDPNAPYWGGLQMDMNFQSAYGPWLLQHKGTANHWTPLQQIWAGVRAWRVRGFEPWSNTAHACGVY